MFKQFNNDYGLCKQQKCIDFGPRCVMEMCFEHCLKYHNMVRPLHTLPARKAQVDETAEPTVGEIEPVGENNEWLS